MRALILGVALALAGPALLLAQVSPRAGVPNLPPLAMEAAPEALKLLRLVKTSSLAPYWRAAALARGARAFARAGDEDMTRTMARDAALALREPFQGQTPPALSAGPINALIAAAMLSIDDKIAAQAQAEIAEEQLNALSDPVTRATVMPYLAQSLIDLNENERAAALLRAGSDAAFGLPPGRDQSTAFLLIVQGQAKLGARLGDRTAAQASLNAFRSAVTRLSEPMDRAFGLAMQGRAEAAAGNAPIGRSRAREAAAAYDRAVGASQTADLQRISTLAAIALAQAETGDRTAAQSTARAMQQTIAQISQPFERCQALILLTDSAMQIEPGS